MSATPEQIAERLEKHPLYFWSGSSEPEYQRSDLPTEAAALIRAQAERVRVLEGLLGDVLPDAERGAYLGEQCSHEYGDGREQPLELTISWDWQQSKPNTGGWGALQEDIDAWLAELRESEIDIPLLRARAALKAAP